MGILTQRDRELASDGARSIINHQLWRLYDAVRETQEIGEDPKVLSSAVSKIQSLASHTQQIVSVYTGLYLAWKENEPKPEAAQPECKSANDVVLDAVSETLRPGVIANADDIPF